MSPGTLRLTACSDGDVNDFLGQLGRRGLGFLECDPRTQTGAVMRRRLRETGARLFHVREDAEAACAAPDGHIGVAGLALNPANPFQARIDVLPAQGWEATGAVQVEAALAFARRYLAVRSFLRFETPGEAAPWFAGAGFTALGALREALFEHGTYRDQLVWYREDSQW
jgi:hypothetical protein